MINYYLLTKPGIVLGNLFTLAAGFLLASGGWIDLRLFFGALAGLALIMASGCVFNNYIDRQVDQKMERTKNRALASGIVTERHALLFAFLLVAAGALLLLFYTNLLALCMAGIGFFVYVFLYSLWKCRTVYGTAIGSIAGAIPPVVGYCAAGNRLDAGAFLFFALMVLWQMPHFFAIALLHIEDYKAAGIPVLPIAKGMLRTKIHMAIYIVAFLCAAPLLTLFGYTGYLYLGMTIGIGLLWLGLCVQGFNSSGPLWERRMFHVSLWVIAAVCIAIPAEQLLLA